MPVKVHLPLARALRALGAETVFGLIGDANLYLVDAFVRECGGRYVGAATRPAHCRWRLAMPRFPAAWAWRLSRTGRG